VNAEYAKAADRLVRTSITAIRECQKATPSAPAPNGKAPAARDLLPFLPNDHGNACRLIELYGPDMRYCHAFRKWLVWDRTRWAVDETDQACRLAKQTILEFLRQAVAKSDERAEKFARGSLDARRIANMLKMAECEIYVRPAELDSDPNLLNFQNGTVDLRTGEMREHQRADLITKLVHHRYRPEAQCPRWRGFLDQIMGGGPNAGEGALSRAQRLTDYLQRALGYSLTGCTIEKAVFVLFGDGDNGKSTMLTTFRQLVEEYAQLLQADTLMVRQESNNTQADLADLRGARFVQTSETEEGQRLAQGKLKRITQGMGKIKAVRKYENPIEFPETHKLWIDTNRKPTIRDVDDTATFNRLHPIPFAVRIPKEQIDKQLPAKLLTEAEGILAWAVAGAKLWHESGLNKPHEVESAKDQWRAEMDQLGRFIEERCTVGDGFTVQASAIYAGYKLWCEENGERILTATAFGRKLAERDLEKRHSERGWRYLGVGLLTGSVNPDGFDG
jgi:putative DNA primase/helicase